MVDLLELPDVYEASVRMFEIDDFDGVALLGTTETLRNLVSLHVKTTDPRNA